MTVALINPPITPDQVFGDWDLSGVDTYCPPLGLLYIAAHIRSHRHAVQIFDATPSRLSLTQLVQDVLSLKPDVVGISSTTVNIFNASRIADELKKQGLVAPVVIGGPHVSALPVETLDRYPCFDYGIVGEGEEAFLEFLEKCKRHESTDEIENLVWRNSGGRIVRNRSRPLIENLDMLPLPAWDLLDNFPRAYPHNALETKRLPAATVLTSRGCPNHCTFCDRSIYGNRVRSHSVDYTLNMIRHLRTTYGIKDLMIVDDNFLLNRERLFKVCDTILEENLDLNWYCLGHVKQMTEDRLTKIRKAGCWIMEVGIESGCDRILQLIKKNTTKTEIAAAITRAKKAGIVVKGNFIFGLPSETKASLQETIDFATAIGIDLFQQTFMTVLPGCELSKEVDMFGTYENDWSSISMYKVNFVPFGLTKEDLIETSKRAFRRFYLRPRIMFALLLRSLESFRSFFNLFAALNAFIKTMVRKSK